MKTIELFEKDIKGDGTVWLIAECNVYENNVRIAQLSRSPFVFPDTMTDQEIIDYLISNEYSRYY